MFRPAVEALERRDVPSAPRPDPVIQWNRVLLDAVRVDRTPPPLAARAMAVVHTAVYDAVNSIDRTGARFAVQVRAPADARPAAAAVEAAFDTLRALFPQQQATFRQALTASLRQLPHDAGTGAGRAVGLAVARQTLFNHRADAAAAAPVQYTPGTGPGDWRPTPPAFAAPLLPNFPTAAPFGLARASQLRPAGPPALTSDAYAAALDEVERLGGANATDRTPEQTQIALFWADGAGTATPPGHWNVIAQTVALARHTTLDRNARLFAVLDVTLADAGLAAWDCKYATRFWRPITAIRAADTDGNPQTHADPAWSPLLATPPFPTYVSGHSTFSAAAADILTRFFGPRPFTTTSDALPGVRRSFRDFQAAAAEAGQSRIYGGIHFQFDNQDGLRLGTQVARYDARLMRPR